MLGDGYWNVHGFSRGATLGKFFSFSHVFVFFFFYNQHIIFTSEEQRKVCFWLAKNFNIKF